MSRSLPNFDCGACFILGICRCCSDALEDGCQRLPAALFGSAAAGIVSGIGAGLFAHYLGELSPAASALIAIGVFAATSSSTCAAICCCPKCKKNTLDEERSLTANV